MLFISIGSLACLFEYHPYWFLLGRTLQGIGSAVFLVVPKAIFRQHYQGGALVNVFALLVGAYGIGATLAPLMGGLITELMGWQMIFYFIILLVNVVLMFMWIVLKPISGPQVQSNVFSLKLLIQRYVCILKVPLFFIFFVIDALMITIYGVSILMLPFIGEHQFQLTPLFVGLLFMCGSIGYLLAGFFAKGLSKHLSHQRLILLAVIIYMTMCAVLEISEYVNVGHLYLFFLGLFGLGVGAGLIDVACQSGAINIIDEHVGVASAIMSVGPFLVAFVVTFF